MEPRMLDKINDLIRIRQEVITKTELGEDVAREIMQECKDILSKADIDIHVFRYHMYPPENQG